MTPTFKPKDKVIWLRILPNRPVHKVLCEVSHVTKARVMVKVTEPTGAVTLRYALPESLELVE